MTILCQRFRAVAYFVLRSHKVEVLPVLPLVYWNQKMVRSELDYTEGLGPRWNGIWIFSWVRKSREAMDMKGRVRCYQRRGARR